MITDLSRFEADEIISKDKIDPDDGLYSMLNEFTVRQWMPFWVRNAAENYQIVPKEARYAKSLLHITNIHWGREAAILASGPSLDESIKHLKNFKGIIFAGNSTANPCIANGITPDWVFMLDADEYVPNQFEGVETDKLKAFLPTYIHPSVPKLFKPELTWWFNVYDYNHWMTDQGLKLMFPKIDGLLAASCCPGGMIRLAHLMGIRKVYLLGFDFGFPGGKERCTVYERFNGIWESNGTDPFCADKSAREEINGIETTLKLKVAHSAIVNIIKGLPDMEAIDCSSGIMTEFPKKNFREVVNGSA